jgi:hypothetical protein
MEKPGNRCLFYVYRILERYSDEKHPMTVEEIIDKLDEVYGLGTERRAVGRSLRILKDLTETKTILFQGKDGEDTEEPFDVIHLPNKGYYLASDSRQFDEGELEFLLASLRTERGMTPGDKNLLIKHLLSSFSNEDQIYYWNLYRKNGTLNGDTKSIKRTLACINEAIKEKKKITYEEIRSENGQNAAQGHILCSPYYLYRDMGKNYFLGTDNSGEVFLKVALEEMADVEMSEEDSLPKEKTLTFKDFDLDRFNEYDMTGCEERDPRIMYTYEIRHPDDMQCLYDEFGKNNVGRITNEQGKKYVQVNGTPSSAWAIAENVYHHIRLVAPGDYVQMLHDQQEDRMREIHND